MSMGIQPEMDESPFASEEDESRPQMLIGIAQWSTSLGRMDILHATMSLSGFSVSPRQKQCEWAKGVMGHLKKFPDVSIAISPDAPDCRGFERIKADWSQHHPDAKEDIPEDVPEPTMEAMRITVFVDADHAHDKKTGMSVTGIVVSLN